MYHYQVGSLEERKAAPARGAPGRAGGLGAAAACIRISRPFIGRRFAEAFDGRAGFASGLEVTGSRKTPPISPLAEERSVERLYAPALVRPAASSCTSASRRIAGRGTAGLAESLGWDVPVARQLGAHVRLRPTRLARRLPRWEYIDTIADDNPEAARGDGRASPRGRPVLMQPLTTWAAGRRSRRVRPPHPGRDRRGAAAGEARSGQRAVTTARTMGFDVYDHAALKGQLLVLREWKDGRSVQVVAHIVVTPGWQGLAHDAERPDPPPTSSPGSSRVVSSSTLVMPPIPVCADCGWLHDEHAGMDDRSPIGTPR